MAYERRDIRGSAEPSVLAGDITSLDTIINVTTVSGWPTGGGNGEFTIRIDSETIYCSSRTSSTLTVADDGRGVEGTAAAAHTAGAAVTHVVSGKDADEANLAVTKTIGQIGAAGRMLISDTANSLEDIDVSTNTAVMVGNGTTGVMRVLSGAATMSNTGVVTLAADQVGSAQIATGAVGSAELADDAVGNAEMQDNSVDSPQYVDGSIDREHLAADIVDGTKLADNAIGNEHIGDDAVTGAEIADNSIVQAHLTDDCVGSAELGEDAVETAHIGDEQVTLAKVANEEWSTYGIAMGSTGGSAAIGNGTLVGRYKRIGRTVHVQASLILGSSTNFGSGTFTMSLPVSCNDSSPTMCIGTGMAVKSSTANYVVSVICVPATSNNVVIFGVNGSIYVKGEAGGLPFGWGTNDYITWSATYEAAT